MIETPTEKERLAELEDTVAAWLKTTSQVTAEHEKRLQALEPKRQREDIR